MICSLVSVFEALEIFAGMVNGIAGCFAGLVHLSFYGAKERLAKRAKVTKFLSAEIDLVVNTV